MSALIGNPLMLTSAPSAGDDAYQIENSLRFSEDDSAYLSRTFATKGNRRTWTWSAWIKLGKLEDNGYIFASRSNNDNRLYLKYNSDGTLYGFTGNSNSKSFTTARKLRDPSAWYHLVWVWDSPNDVERDRQRVYINGEHTTNTATNSYTQNFEGAINDSIEHRLCNAIHQNEIFDGMMADVQFVDGLALSPAAFGSFDSAGNWNPKAFELPAPNDGTTWSSSVSGAVDNASYSHDKLFDGYLGTAFNSTLHGNNVFTYPDENTTNTFTPSSPIVAKQQIRVYIYRYDDLGQFWWNGVDHTETVKAVLTGHGSVGWVEMPTRTLTSMAWKWITGTGIPYMGAIEVDGVILVDGKTDVTKYNNPNNGRTWSDDLTATGGINDADRTFNGLAPNAGSAGALTYGVSQGGTMTFAPTGGIVFKDTIELYTDQGSTYTVNGGSSQTFGPSTGQSNGIWYTVATGGGTLTSLTWTPQNNSYYPSSAAIRIDGHILIDGTVDNSFHLKFNDTSLNRYLGKDTLNGKIADATGGKPILTTTDDYGDVTGGAVNTSDSNKSHIVLAVSGHNSIADVHHTVKGSGSAKTATANGNAALSTDESRFYGQSIKCDGTGDYVSFADSADWDIGSSDACGECWVYGNSWGGYEGLFGQWNNSNYNVTNSWILEPVNGTLNFYYCHGSSIANITGASMPVKQWTHVAFTKDGSTLTLYQNGRKTGSGTLAGTIQNGTGTFDIGGNVAGGGSLNGYIQDVRLYKGTKKYTGNFKPPTRNDFAVNNLIASSSSTYRDRMTGGVEENSANIAGSYWYRYLFDGSSSTTIRANGNHEVRYTETRSSVTDLALRTHFPSGNTANGTKFYVNGSLVTPTSKVQNGWTVLPAPAGNNLTSFGFGRDGNDYVYVSGMRINNVELTENFEEDVDSFTDSPTNYGTESNPAVGGEVRGNYATLNPLTYSGTLSQGNLTFKPDHASMAAATIAAYSGKYYWEFTCNSNDNFFAGLMGLGGRSDPAGRLDGNDVFGLGGTSGSASTNQAASTKTDHNGGFTGSILNSEDVIGIALDADAKTCDVYLNNTKKATFSSFTHAGPYLWAHDRNGNGTELFHYNFGQRPFKYSAPAGYKCLCTQNLDNLFDSETSENNPSKYFDIITYHGTGASKTFSGLGFGPDMIWTKQRSSTGEPRIQDQIRGTDSQIRPNGTGSELTETNNVTAFTSDGYTIGTNGDINSSSHTHVAWLWDAGTAAATPSAVGSLDPTDQWVNATAGFSISMYTSTGSSDDTIGHGLNAKPDFIIIKNINNASRNWAVYHSSIGAEKYLWLNDDNDMADDAEYWHDTEPNNTVFSIGNWSAVNGTNNKHIVYAWTAIPGYSAFGSYEGNDGNGTGPFVYTGFRPRWIMIKSADQDESWVIHDSSRGGNNEVYKWLKADSDGSENSTEDNNSIDILSNGFIPRAASGSNAAINEQTLVYAAFAEHPFKTTRAR